MAIYCLKSLVKGVLHWPFYRPKTIRINAKSGTQWVLPIWFSSIRKDCNLFCLFLIFEMTRGPREFETFLNVFTHVKSYTKYSHTFFTVTVTFRYTKFDHFSYKGIWDDGYLIISHNCWGGWVDIIVINVEMKWLTLCNGGWWDDIFVVVYQW